MTELIIAQIVVTVIAGAITGGASILLYSIRESWKEQKAEEKKQAEQQRLVLEGLQAVLRVAIYERAKTGNRLGFATIKDKEIMEMSYKPYHDLGGNGVVTELYETYMALPIDN